MKYFKNTSWLFAEKILRMFVGVWVVAFLYGGKYNQAGSILTIHIWAGVFVFLYFCVFGCGKWFLSKNSQMLSFWRTLAGGILLNYILIPIYGISGAAFATLISQAIASYLFNMTNKKSRHTFLLQTNAILLPFRKSGVKFG